MPNSAKAEHDGQEAKRVTEEAAKATSPDSAQYLLEIARHYERLAEFRDRESN